MKNMVMAHDEGARQRVESLERFVAKRLDIILLYCAYHNIHYSSKEVEIPTMLCPRAENLAVCKISVA